MRQQVVEGFALALGRPGREKLHRPVNQVVRVALGSFDGGHVVLDAALANKAVGIEPSVEGNYPDLKILFGEQGNRLLRGVCAGGVRVEIDEETLGVAAEQAHLQLGKCRSAGGEHILNSRHVRSDAVHLAFHQQGKVLLPDCLPRLVEIEQHLPLGIERGLGRVHILRPGFFLAVERPRRKSNHSP